MQIELDIKVELSGVEQMKANLGLQPFGPVQKFVDSECKRWMDDYVPCQLGELKDSAQRSTIIGSGQIVYNQPYARFQYYGKVMVGEESNSPFARKNERKVLTDRNLTYNDAPQRGAFWAQRMKADHMKEIVKGAQKIVERGGG